MSIKKEPGSRFGLVVKHLDATIPSFSVEGLAESVVMSPKQIWRWFSGDGEPNFSTISYLHREYRISLDYIVLGKGTMFVPAKMTISMAHPPDDEYLTEDRRRIAELEKELEEKQTQLRDKERIIELYERLKEPQA